MAKYALKGKRVFVAGHRGMVGSAVVRRLERDGCTVITASRSDLDLVRQDQVDAFFLQTRPQAVFMAAAKVGGIYANATFPADFLYDNLLIAANVTRAAFATGVEKMLFLGSSCIYPKYAPQPIAETALLTGALEPTNEWYAVAKIAGIKLAQAYRRQHGCDFISAMPTNLYGPGDNFNLDTSHVLPALIRKAHEAKIAGDPTFTVWGTGLHCVSFCTPTTARTRWSTSCRSIRTTSTSTSDPAATSASRTWLHSWRTSSASAVKSSSTRQSPTGRHAN